LVQVTASYTLGFDGYLAINASIKYPCPYPMCVPPTALYVAQQSFVNITLPKHLVLVGQDSPVIQIGSFAPDAELEVSWLVQVLDSFGKCGRDVDIVITAQGLISGSVPYTVCTLLIHNFIHSLICAFIVQKPK
jgi:hypothetical protein